MKLFVIAAIALPMATTPVLAWTVCGDGVPVDRQLNWARGDTGHNEGAACGADILANAAGISLPPFHQVLPYGEVFKRNAMMSAAIAAYKKGYHEEAVSVAICSQVHNAAAHECLKQNRTEIKSWFNTQ